MQPSACTQQLKNRSGHTYENGHQTKAHGSRKPEHEKPLQTSSHCVYQHRFCHKGGGQNPRQPHPES
ncbi:hypothetical protein J6590_053806 [Homalodisca vitripennis]|nr:hypothetical protein J6590_053806 [Homalodisca vitripennis]